MKRYRIQLPTPTRCTELGVKFEGQEVRTRLWLMGVACGVSYCGDNNRFNVGFTSRTHFVVECNNSTIINNVRDHLEPYGATVEEIRTIPNCPSCNGQREIERMAGGVPVYKCYFCGMVAT